MMVHVIMRMALRSARLWFDIALWILTEFAQAVAAAKVIRPASVFLLVRRCRRDGHAAHRIGQRLFCRRRCSRCHSGVIVIAPFVRRSVLMLTVLNMLVALVVATRITTVVMVCMWI